MAIDIYVRDTLLEKRCRLVYAAHDGNHNLTRRL